MPAKEPPASTSYQSAWFWVLFVVGLDYFSTLGYQPSIAFEAAGLLAPLATVVLVLVTLFGALPVYWYVARHSPHGQGSFAMLERLIPGWRGKTLILILLGFAATDFVFTRTLSTADAAQHMILHPNAHWQALLDTLAAAGNRLRFLFPHPVWQWLVDYWDRQMVVTLLLLVLGFYFMTLFRRGFTRRGVQLAMLVVGIYLGLNALVIISGLIYLTTHAHVMDAWWERVWQGHGDPGAPGLLPGGGWWAILVACVVLFPKLALGLSGFEMSMVAMPLIKGGSSDDPRQPEGRIRNTRKLLVAAALIMSLYLLGSAFVTSLLIPQDAFTGGPATNRALAYLAHGEPLAAGISAGEVSPLFGRVFGTLYDLSTVAILCLAGASVALALRTLVPQFLYRFGMELEWAHQVGAIIIAFNVIKLIITVLFEASVTAQREAYATGVLVLMTTAALTAAYHAWRQPRGAPSPLPRGGEGRVKAGFPWLFTALAAVFMLTAVTVVSRNLEGIQIAFWFILVILLSSIVSRMARSTELRFQGFEFKDEQSQFLWDTIRHLEFPIVVPHRPGRRGLEGKEKSIRQRHRLVNFPILFIEVQLGDASDFYQLPLMEVTSIDDRVVVRVSRCVSVAHVIAAIGLELAKAGPLPELHFGWSDESPLASNLNFVLFGEGNVPWMVRELIRRAEPAVERRPRIVVG